MVVDSTRGLLLAGTLVKPSELSNNNPAKYIGGLISKSGEMPIRNAVLAAMHILSKEFVMGRDFNDIAKLKNIDQYTYSFDMLGEAARTDHQAEKYFHKNPDQAGSLTLPLVAGSTKAAPLNVTPAIIPDSLSVIA